MRKIHTAIALSIVCFSSLILFVEIHEYFVKQFGWTIEEVKNGTGLGLGLMLIWGSIFTGTIYAWYQALNK